MPAGSRMHDQSVANEGLGEYARGWTTRPNRHWRPESCSDSQVSLLPGAKIKGTHAAACEV